MHEYKKAVGDPVRQEAAFLTILDVQKKYAQGHYGATYFPELASKETLRVYHLSPQSLAMFCNRDPKKINVNHLLFFYHQDGPEVSEFMQRIDDIVNKPAADVQVILDELKKRVVLPTAT
jgi:hypothetical protein